MVKFNTEKGLVQIPVSFHHADSAARQNCFGVQGMALRSVSDGLSTCSSGRLWGKGSHHNSDDDTICIELHIIVKTGYKYPGCFCKSIMEESQIR